MHVLAQLALQPTKGVGINDTHFVSMHVLAQLALQPGVLENLMPMGISFNACAGATRIATQPRAFQMRMGQAVSMHVLAQLALQPVYASCFKSEPWFRFTRSAQYPRRP